MLFMLFFRIFAFAIIPFFPWLRTKYGANMINFIRMTKRKYTFFFFFL